MAVVLQTRISIRLAPSCNSPVTSKRQGGVSRQTGLSPVDQHPGRRDDLAQVECHTTRGFLRQRKVPPVPRRTGISTQGIVTAPVADRIASRPANQLHRAVYRRTAGIPALFGKRQRHLRREVRHAGATRHCRLRRRRCGVRPRRPGISGHRHALRVSGQRP